MRLVWHKDRFIEGLNSSNHLLAEFTSFSFLLVANKYIGSLRLT